MRKIALVIFFCSISMLVFAQEQVSWARATKGNMALSFNVAGLYNLAINSSVDSITGDQIFDGRYFIKDNLSFRLGLSLNTNYRDNFSTSDTTGGLPLIESRKIKKNHSYSIRLGMENHISTNAKTIDPFIGLSVHFSRLGGKEVIDSDKTIQPNGDFTDIRIETINPEGYAIAFQMNAGFFWYFVKGVALGAEFSFGHATAVIGGLTTVTTNTTSSTGGIVNSTETIARSDSKENMSIFQTLNLGSINLLVRF